MFFPIFVKLFYRMRNFFLIFLVSTILFSCNNEKTNNSEVSNDNASITTPQVIGYSVVSSYPHDTSSYTQGLIWKDSTLYEGTGLENHSKLMKIDLYTGKQLQSVSIDPTFFGEGITILHDTLYQLTWQDEKVLVYDPKTFRKIKEYTWEHEGWGIAQNGNELIISTGESNIYFVDPQTFKVKRIIGVTDNNGPVGNLNELEYVDGAIYANRYLTDFIYKIDPENGHVLGILDMTGLLAKAGQSVDVQSGYVLNGIAYNNTKKTFYITGKKWPLLFEMKFN